MQQKIGANLLFLKQMLFFAEKQLETVYLGKNFCYNCNRAAGFISFSSVCCTSSFGGFWPGIYARPFFFLE